MLETMINDICGPDIFTSIYETLSINLFSSGGKYAMVLSVIRVVYNIIMPVGVYLMFIYFLLALVDKLSSDTFTWEQLWRQLALLIGAKVLMENGFQILETLFGVGMTILGKISAAASTDIAEVTVDAAEMIEEFGNSVGGLAKVSVFRDIIMFVYLLIPWALSWLMRLAVSVVCYSRVIEIYAKAAFAPVALSDFMHSGVQGSGWRWLKSFFASCLQGAIIFLVAVIFSALFQTISIDATGNIFKFLGAYLAFYASAVVLMFKTLPLAKEIVGAA